MTVFFNRTSQKSGWRSAPVSGQDHRHSLVGIGGEPGRRKIRSRRGKGVSIGIAFSAKLALDCSGARVYHAASAGNGWAFVHDGGTA